MSRKTYEYEGHAMQHAKSPTWCVHCGTFDIYCQGSECADVKESKFDSRVKKTKQRMFTDLFGLPSPIESVNATALEGKDK